MKKKISLFVIAISMLLSFSTIVQSVDVTNWIVKGVFYVLKKGANVWYEIPAEISKGEYGATVTPGTLDFNKGDVGASVTFDVASQSTNHSLALYGTSSPINYGKHLSIIVVNPNGNDTVNTSVTPGQRRGFKFGLTGTYNARFVVNDSWRMAP